MICCGFLKKNRKNELTGNMGISGSYAVAKGTHVAA